VFHFLVEFSVASIKSVLFGFGSGAVSCLIHKTFEAFGHFPILETCLIFLMALFCYTLAEISGLAAIVCIFVFGIVQSQYNRFNLSYESVEKAGYDFQNLF